MRVLGLLAGLGSMLREAQDRGWTVLGNVESRPVFYTRPWWRWNFPGTRSYLSGKRAASEDWRDADLALGHPPCGAHSVLGESKISLDLDAGERKRRQARRAAKVGLLPEFAELVRAFEPKMFALDNLPKILRTVAPLDWWAKQLPRYRISTTVITNGDYGCVQRRRRLWIFGVRKDVGPAFQFHPIEKRPREAPRTTLEALDGIPWEPWLDQPTWAHWHLGPHDYPRGGFRYGRGRNNQLLEHVALPALRYLNVQPKNPWIYEIQTSRRISNKVGWIRADPMGYSRVLSGFPSVFHPMTGWPLTPRERARLMGWPDDFQLNDNQPFDMNLFAKLTTVTGRGVPSEFLRYGLLPQVETFLEER